MQVYLDRGSKVDRGDGDEIMCIASVIFKSTRYKQFIRPWNRMLRAWNASAFHATDFYNGAEEFARDTSQRERLFKEDSPRIPGMIAEHVKRVLIVSFRPKEVDQMAPPYWKESLGTNVHSLAVQLALIANGYWLRENRQTGSFAYLMERGDPDEAEVSRAVEGMRADKITGTANIIKVKSFTIVDKGTARGLEASDFVAWYWNKHYIDNVKTGHADKPRKDFEAFVNLAKGKVDDIFATREKLKYFLSLRPH